MPRTPERDRSRTLAMEPLEKREMLDADPIVLPTIDELRGGVGTAITGYLADLQSAELQRSIDDADAAIVLLESQQQDARSALQHMLSLPLYTRSTFARPLDHYPPSLAPFITTYAQQTEKLLQQAIRRINVESTGSSAMLKTLDNAIAKYLQTSQVQLAQLARKLPASVRPYAQDIVLPSSVGALLEAAHDLQQTETALHEQLSRYTDQLDQHSTQRTVLQESLQNQSYPLRDRATSIDGTPEEERAVVDGILEQALSRLLPLPVSLEEGTAGAVRADVREGTLVTRMTREEFDALAQSLAAAVACAPDGVAQTDLAIREALADNPLFTELLEESVQAIAEHLAPPPIATPEEMRVILAEALNNHLIDSEIASLEADIAVTKQKLPQLEEKTQQLLHAIDDYLASPLYLRTYTYTREAMFSIWEREALRPFIAQQNALLTEMVREAILYMDIAAQGNQEATQQARAALDAYVCKYNNPACSTSGEYELASTLRNKRMEVPHSTNALLTVAQPVFEPFGAMRTQLRATQATIRTSLANVERWQTMLATSSFDLRRQSAGIDGNTTDERATVGRIIEQSLSEGLRMPAHFVAERLRQGPRVGLQDGAIKVGMTDKEFQALLQAASGAVATSDGAPDTVSSALQDALLQDTVLLDILNRSHTIAQRHRESPIQAEILQSVEAAHEIPYARLHLEARQLDYTYTQLTVRLRNPGPQTFVRTHTQDPSGFGNGHWSQLLEHPDGLADGRITFNMKRHFNGTTQRVELCLYADASQSKLLDRIVFTFDQHQNRARILTEQPAWDDYEEGRLERAPVEPKLMIYGTHKHNVLVAVQSPSDQSVVTFERGGMLDTDHLTHDGGTGYAMGTATFNVTLPSGQYPLRLYDRPDGLLLDTVLFRWDKATQTLTPVDPADGAREIPEGDAAAADVLSYFQTAVTMDDRIFYGEQHWQRVLHSVIMEQTRDYPAPYNMTYDLNTAFYSVHPQYLPENIQATIDAEWERVGTGFSRKQAQDWVLRRHNELRNLMYESAVEYNIALGEILGAAVEGMQRIRMGRDPATAFTSLRALWESHENPNNYLRASYRSRCVDTIQSLTGLRLPTPDIAIEIARRVMDRIMVRLQDMIQDHNRTVQQLINNGYHLNGDGNWVPNSTYTPSSYNPDLDALSRTATRFSRWFGTEVAMADPRLDVVSQSDGTQRVVLATLDQNFTEGQTVAAIDRLFDVALTTATEFETDGADLLNGLVRDEAMSFIDLRIALRQYDDATLMHVAEGWYRRTGTPGQYPVYGSQSVRDDAVAGRIFNGIMQQAESKQGVELRLMLCIAERVIGIRAVPLYNLLKAGDTHGFFTALMVDFQARNYGHIFVSQPGVLPQTTHIAGFTLDRTSYTEQDTFLRLTFDIVGATPTFSQWNVYLADAHGTRILGAPALFEENRTGGLSGDISMFRLQQVLPGNLQSGGTFTLRLAVWKDPDDTAGLPGNIISDPFTLSFHQSIAEPGEGGGNVLKHLSDDPVENAVLNEVSKNFPLEGDPAKWRWVIASAFHTGNDFHAADLNLGAGDDDYGKEIRAVADGVIGPIGLDFGSVRILHRTQINGQETHWQSIMLHMPIYATSRTASNGKPIYEVRNRDGSVTNELYEGMVLNAGQSYGVVAGRGLLNDGSRSDTAFSPHAHQEIEIDGRTTDLRTTLAAWGIMNVTASDGHAFVERPVHWDAAIGMWMNDEFNIALDRSTQTGAGNADANWVAWHQDPAQRQTVIWKKIRAVGESEAKNRWVRSDNETQEWNGQEWIQLTHAS